MKSIVMQYLPPMPPIITGSATGVSTKQSQTALLLPLHSIIGTMQWIFILFCEWFQAKIDILEQM